MDVGRRSASVARGGRRRRKQRNGGGRGAPRIPATGSAEITQARVAMRPVYGQVAHISRSNAYLLTRAGADAGYFFDWSLSDVSNAAEFTALFQQWRLRGTHITFTWRSSNEANPARPSFTFAVDPFATAAPGSLNSLLERPNRVWSPNANRTVLQLTVQARALSLTASGAGSGALVISALAPKGLYFPTSSTSLAYGSLLLWIGGWTTAGDNVEVRQTYDFEFRGSQ